MANCVDVLSYGNLILFSTSLGTKQQLLSHIKTRPIFTCLKECGDSYQARIKDILLLTLSESEANVTAWHLEEQEVPCNLRDISEQCSVVWFAA